MYEKSVPFFEPVTLGFLFGGIWIDKNVGFSLPAPSLLRGSNGLPCFRTLHDGKILLYFIKAYVGAIGIPLDLLVVDEFIEYVVP
jgi:hypothetical protein